MGHKSHPYGLRVGIVNNWKSRWFAKRKDYPSMLLEDHKIKEYIKKTFQTAAVSRIEIERASERVRVIIFSARPGIIIGRKGADIDRLKEELNKITGKEIFIDIKEIKNPYLESQLVAENIAFQLEKRIAFKRAMKKAIQQAMEGGAKGIRMQCAGRLGGAEIARTEGYRRGSIPLQTFRANIDYGFYEAHTAYGSIGVKVWIYKDEAKQSSRDKKEADLDGLDAKKS
ncbi:MAG: 30S ribosomal protein S3 [Candidatus Omnitrophica bacterium]|nr:30S ribosomal protein S3 [Candidatus Omnitrophota bacterium]